MPFARRPQILPTLVQNIHNEFQLQAIQLANFAGRGRDLQGRARRVGVLSGLLVTAGYECYQKGRALIDHDFNKTDPNFQLKAAVVIDLPLVLVGITIAYIFLRECIDHLRGR